jgi:hypothetical protein
VAVEPLRYSVSKSRTTGPGVPDLASGRERVVELT